MKHALALLVVVVVPGCTGHFGVAPSREVFAESTTENGRLELSGDVAIGEVKGSPEAVGVATAELTAKPFRELLSTWTSLEALRRFVTDPPRAEDVLPFVPEDHRRELEALARRAGVDANALLRANAVADSCACTAFIASGAATRDGALVVGRNMDFLPANLLGRSTFLLVVRPEGKRAFASIGWPGMTAVASGMNQDGLVAAILINHGARPRGNGVPLAFLVRRLLEECGSVAEARALFERTTPASGHYVFVADAHEAAVLSRDVAPRAAQDGVLTCSNGAFDAAAGCQRDERARALEDLVRAGRGELDEGLARAILGAVYLKRANCQAIVFEPARGVIHLARGTTFGPAALEPWWRLDLTAVLAAPGAPLVATRDDDVTPLPHYTDQGYAGLVPEQRLRRARSKLARLAKLGRP